MADGSASTPSCLGPTTQTWVRVLTVQAVEIVWELVLRCAQLVKLVKLNSSD